MKKLTIAIAALSISVSSFAWGPAEQAGLIGLIAGGLIVNAVKDQPKVAPPQEAIIQQRYIPYGVQNYETRQRAIVEPNFIYEPPIYSQSTDQFIYKPPMIYDIRSGQWLQQSKIYIPANRHFIGCNFYNYDEAWECIHRKESILNGTYGR